MYFFLLNKNTIVWFSHLLQSSEYFKFTRSIAEGLETVPHCSDWIFDAKDVWELLERSRSLWTQKCESTCGPFDEDKWTKVLSSKPVERAVYDVGMTPRSPVSGVRAKDARVQLSKQSGLSSVPLDHIPAPHMPVCDSMQTLPKLAVVVVDDAEWFLNFCVALKGKVMFSDAELERFLIVRASNKGVRLIV